MVKHRLDWQTWAEGAFLVGGFNSLAKGQLVRSSQERVYPSADGLVLAQLQCPCSVLISESFVF